MIITLTATLKMRQLVDRLNNGIRIHQLGPYPWKWVLWERKGVQHLPTFSARRIGSWTHFSFFYGLLCWDTGIVWSYLLPAGQRGNSELIVSHNHSASCLTHCSRPHLTSDYSPSKLPVMKWEVTYKVPNFKIFIPISLLQTSKLCSILNFLFNDW